MDAIEIKVISATRAARLLELFKHLPPFATTEQAEEKLREVMGEELFRVCPSWLGHVYLAYAGDGVWLRIEVPGLDGRMHDASGLTPNDGAGTEDYAPNH